MLDIQRPDFVAGVAGSGTMGRGIVQVLAQCGVRTLVFDAKPGAAQAAKEAIGKTLAGLVQKGRVSQADADKTLARIEIVDALAVLKPCHVVIEAIVELLAPKQGLFKALEAVVSESCILASNTSSLSVTAMAAACARPGRVAGYHFFNPVPVMKIVEVVDGELTEPWVGDALVALARRYGHKPVRCKDTPGFIVNHAGRGYVPESLRVLQEGVAEKIAEQKIPSGSLGSAWCVPELKDLLIRLGAKVEPKPASDSVCFVAPLGHDATSTALQLNLDPSRTVAIDPLFGFGKRRTLMATPVTRPEVRDAAHALLASDGVPVSVIRDSAGFVAQRVVAHIVNVACDIVQQRIATPEDLDSAVVLGLGYPHGPLAMGDALGAQKVLGVLDAMHECYREPRYRPSPWLRRRAQLGVSLLTEES